MNVKPIDISVLKQKFLEKNDQEIDKVIHTINGGLMQRAEHGFNNYQYVIRGSNKEIVRCAMAQFKQAGYKVEKDNDFVTVSFHCY